MRPVGVLRKSILRDRWDWWQVCRAAMAWPPAPGLTLRLRQHHPLPTSLQLPALLGRGCRRHSAAPGRCPGGCTLPVCGSNSGAPRPTPLRQPLCRVSVSLALLWGGPPCLLLQRSDLTCRWRSHRGCGSCRPGCGGGGAGAALCAPRLPGCGGEPARAGHQHGTGHQRCSEARRCSGRKLRCSSDAPPVCWQRRHPCGWAAQVEAGPGGGAEGHLRAGGRGCGGGAGTLNAEHGSQLGGAQGQAIGCTE